jgi:hypothetical protein
MKKAAHRAASLAAVVLHSEVKTDFCGKRAGRDVVRTAESGKKVVQGIFVGHIDGRKAQTDSVFVAAEYIVMPQGDVKKTP